MAFPSRYRSRSGTSPAISPIKLSPVNEEDLPALRPDMHASAIQGEDGPSPLPPPPITIPRPPRQFRTTFDSELAKPRPISPIAPANSRYGGIKGMMAPPGVKRHAEGDIVGLNGPELGVVGEGPNPELVAPLGGTAQPISQPTQLPPLDEDALPNTGAEGTKDLPVDEVAKPEPPPEPAAPPAPLQTGEAAQPLGEGEGSAQALPATTPAPRSGVSKYTQELDNLKAPARPENNWAQRLGLALLATTKFAPIANQIMHPKWADQQSAYTAQVADAERHQKEDETAAATEASVAQKQAQAKYRDAEAERQAQLHDERIAKVNESQNATFLKALGPDAYQVADKSEALPEGYHFWTSPTGSIYARPGGAISIPPEMVPLFPGSKPGDLKTRKEYDTALQGYRTQQNQLALEAAKVADRDTSKQITPEQRVAAIAAGVDPTDPTKWTKEDAAAVNRQIASQHQALHVTVNSDKKNLQSAINDAYRAAGGDWQKVADNARAGNVEPAFAADIAEHAEKLLKLPPTQQTKVTAADTTIDTAQKAIAAIDAFTKAHPNLTGSVLDHPMNAGVRKLETWSGTEPADIGAVDTLLESVAALQPGQHGFRSAEAAENFKKSLGIDPRTGKSDGSRAWLINPQKAIEGIKQLADFNTNLRDNTLKNAGRTPAKADPAGIRDLIPPKK